MRFLYIIFIILPLILSIFPFASPGVSPSEPARQMFSVGAFLPWWTSSSSSDISRLSWVSLFALAPEKGEWVSLFDRYGGTIPTVPDGVKVLWTVRIFHFDDGEFMKSPSETYAMVKKLDVFLEDSDGIVLDVEDYCLWAYILNFTRVYRRLFPHKLLYITLPDFKVPVDMSMIEDADMFLLMAYDYSPEEGILSPLSGVKRSLEDYAFLKPKLSLGIPLYGYVFNTRGWITVRGESLLGAECKDLREDDGQMRCMVSGTLTDEGGDILAADGYPAVFLKPDEIKSRISLAKKEHLAGVFFWALGYEPIP